MKHTHAHPPVRQRGLSLIEALIALLVLSLGMLAVARLQPQLRQHAELARQRSEALRLAQEDIERLRSYSTLDAAAGGRSYADIVAAQHTIDADDGLATNTDYRLTRDIDATATPHAEHASVSVEWPDRSGAMQKVTLATLIAGIDPGLSGALTLAARGVPVRGVQARSPHIPVMAKDLGDGRSVFKPVAGGIAGIVFDNRSGAVVATCSGLAAGTATQDLAVADLSGCTEAHGMLVRGEIRFSDTNPPQADAANDPPLPLRVTLTLEGAAPAVAPWCNAQAMKTVSFLWAGSLHHTAVPLDATPASLSLTEWTERGERFVAYHCVMIPPAGMARWSGRTEIVAEGWSIGTGPLDRRVCRFAADLDGSGAIDANIEHPAIYQNVDQALARQNFLVIRGDATCPAASGTLEARLATVQHQP